MVLIYKIMTTKDKPLTVINNIEPTTDKKNLTPRVCDC